MFISGWRLALRSKWPFIIIVISNKPGKWTCWPAVLQVCMDILFTRHEFTPWERLFEPVKLFEQYPFYLQVWAWHGLLPP